MSGMKLEVAFWNYDRTRALADGVVTIEGVNASFHSARIVKELAAERPEVVKAVYQGFCDAKQVATEQYVKGMTFNNMAIMLPWFSKLIDEDRSLLGEDWWPYGMEANRKAVDAVLRYHHEQGFTKRRLTCEDIFAKELLDT